MCLLHYALDKVLAKQTQLLSETMSRCQALTLSKYLPRLVTVFI